MNILTLEPTAIKDPNILVSKLISYMHVSDYSQSFFYDDVVSIKYILSKKQSITTHLEEIKEAVYNLVSKYVDVSNVDVSVIDTEHELGYLEIITIVTGPNYKVENRNRVTRDTFEYDNESTSDFLKGR